MKWHDLLSASSDVKKCDKVQTADQGIKKSKLYSETNEIPEILVTIHF